MDGYDDGYAQTAPVGQFYPNRSGVYDLSGNVWEWCSDWYDKDYYETASAGRDPTGPGSGSARAVRGGSWLDFGQYLRASCRDNYVPSRRLGVLGFRLARSL